MTILASDEAESVYLCNFLLVQPVGGIRLGCDQARSRPPFDPAAAASLLYGSQLAVVGSRLLSCRLSCLAEAIKQPEVPGFVTSLHFVATPKVVGTCSEVPALPLHHHARLKAQLLALCVSSCPFYAWVYAAAALQPSLARPLLFVVRLFHHILLRCVC